MNESHELFHQNIARIESAIAAIMGQIKDEALSSAETKADLAADSVDAPDKERCANLAWLERREAVKHVAKKLAHELQQFQDRIESILVDDDTSFFEDAGFGGLIDTIVFDLKKHLGRL